jgi:hypothetical protein
MNCTFDLSNEKKLLTDKLKVMKTQTNNLFNTLNKTQVENLTNVVNETLVPGYQCQTAKSFSTADLWNIQRQQKTSISRRRYF